MPDKDTKAMRSAEDTPGGKASPNPQDSRRSVFYSVKVPLRACREQRCRSLAGEAVQVQASCCLSLSLSFLICRTGGCEHQRENPLNI